MVMSGTVARPDRPAGPKQAHFYPTVDEVRQSETTGLIALSHF